MRRFLLLISCLMLNAGVCQAETADTDKAQKAMSVSRKQLEAVVSDSSFFSEKPAVFHPQCDNPRLLEKVKARIEQYYQQQKQTSIIDERRQVLMLKKLKTFTPVDVQNFPPQENYAVADRLIDIKINEGVKAQDLSLCKSSGEREIYLLIYPQNNFYTIEIINFPGQADSKNFTTVYD